MASSSKGNHHFYPLLHIHEKRQNSLTMVSVHKHILIKRLCTLRLTSLNWFFVIQRLKEAGAQLKSFFLSVSLR